MAKKNVASAVEVIVAQLLSITVRGGGGDETFLLSTLPWKSFVCRGNDVIIS